MGWVGKRLIDSWTQFFFPPNPVRLRMNPILSKLSLAWWLWLTRPRQIHITLNLANHNKHFYHHLWWRFTCLWVEYFCASLLQSIKIWCGVLGLQNWFGAKTTDRPVSVSRHLRPLTYDKMLASCSVSLLGFCDQHKVPFWILMSLSA